MKVGGGDLDPVYRRKTEERPGRSDQDLGSTSVFLL
jgi:hypothetical protein